MGWPSGNVWSLGLGAIPDDRAALPLEQRNALWDALPALPGPTIPLPGSTKQCYPMQAPVFAPYVRYKLPRAANAKTSTNSLYPDVGACAVYPQRGVTRYAEVSPCGYLRDAQTQTWYLPEFDSDAARDAFLLARIASLRAGKIDRDAQGHAFYGSPEACTLRLSSAESRTGAQQVLQSSERREVEADALRSVAAALQAQIDSQPWQQVAKYATIGVAAVAVLVGANAVFSSMGFALT